jgi:hypothetical protein
MSLIQSFNYLQSYNLCNKSCVRLKKLCTLNCLSGDKLTLTYLLTYLHTYLLTPWSRVLLEKLTGFAASQEIPRIYGTRKFITVPTSARQLSLSWARSIQYPQSPPTSWRSILILSFHLCLGLPNGLLPSGFPNKRQTDTNNTIIPCTTEPQVSLQCFKQPRNSSLGQDRPSPFS